MGGIQILKLPKLRLAITVNDWSNLNSNNLIESNTRKAQLASDLPGNTKDEYCRDIKVIDSLDKF